MIVVKLLILMFRVIISCFFFSILFKFVHEYILQEAQILKRKFDKYL